MHEIERSPRISHSLKRRTLLQIAVSAIALGASAGAGLAETAAPQTLGARFMALSRIVTGYDDLNPETAERIFNALTAADPAMSGALGKLADLAAQNSDAKALQAAAAQGGLAEALSAVLSAWYTGTVVSKTAAPVVVAYREALMYRPVEDGLTVPTYCNKGPMWWQDALPPGVTRMPVNNPKVL